MPTREYRRLWCKHCQNWELFEQHYPNWEDWFCKKCENVHEKTLLSEIPEELILEQRKRYIEWNTKETNKLFGDLMMTPEDHALKEFLHMFSKPGESLLQKAMPYSKDEGSIRKCCKTLQQLSIDSFCGLSSG